MEKREKELLPWNLQFFAEDDGSDDSGTGDNGGSGEDQNSGDDNSGEKTFTQTQVSAMMTREKNEGKRSILKSLGFNNEDEAKKAMEAYNAFMNHNKTEGEKNSDDVKKANEEKNESELRAIAAENKLTCFECGVNKDSIDDVLAIASTKVTESKNLEQVLKEMKKENKYSSFFNTSDQSNSGTGRNPGHQKGGTSGEAGELGKRLAGLSSGQSKDQKSNFF